MRLNRYAIRQTSRNTSAPRGFMSLIRSAYKKTIKYLAFSNNSPETADKRPIDNAHLDSITGNIAYLQEVVGTILEESATSYEIQLAREQLGVYNQRLQNFHRHAVKNNLNTDLKHDILTLMAVNDYSAAQLDKFNPGKSLTERLNSYFKEKESISFQKKDMDVQLLKVSKIFSKSPVNGCLKKRTGAP